MTLFTKLLPLDQKSNQALSYTNIQTMVDTHYFVDNSCVAECGKYQTPIRKSKKRKKEKWHILDTVEQASKAYSVKKAKLS